MNDLNIQIKAAHVSEDAAFVDVGACNGRVAIDPGVAVTIASWYASSGTVGKVLAAFSTGCEVDKLDLLADIVASRWELRRTPDNTPATHMVRLQQERALIALIDFVITWEDHREEECGECKALVAVGASVISEQHHDSCSLHPNNVIG